MTIDVIALLNGLLTVVLVGAIPGLLVNLAGFITGMIRLNYTTGRFLETEKDRITYRVVDDHYVVRINDSVMMLKNINASLISSIKGICIFGSLVVMSSIVLFIV